MRYLELFEQFNDKSNTTFSEAVLAALEPTLMNIAERMKKSIAKEFEEKFGRKKEFTEWDVEMIKLGLIVDLFKSFQNYIYDTDKLISVTPNEGAKGIEISAVIERAGVQYDYFTYAIYAGGHNIQRLHMRYLVKTKLPKIKSDIAREYEQKYKNLTKAEKIDSEIKRKEKEIERDKQDHKWALTLSDEEKIEHAIKTKGYVRRTWQEIIDNGAAGNFNNSEEEFNEYMRDSDKDQIKYFDRYFLDLIPQTIKTREKDIEKLKIKLQKLL